MADQTREDDRAHAQALAEEIDRICSRLPRLEKEDILRLIELGPDEDHRRRIHGE